MRGGYLIGHLAMLLGGMFSSSAAHAGTDSTPIATMEAVIGQYGAAEPGCVAGAQRHGEPPRFAAAGLADVGRKIPLTADAVFNIASVSKQFTAFSILLLMHEGKLALDDPVARYVPELEATAQDVTIRHLLHHTGGLRDYEGLLGLSGRTIADGATQHETIALLARQRRGNFAPGSEYEYSNSGYVLLGTIVERISAMPFRTFVEQRIFHPLGMQHSSVVDRYPAGIGKLARGYSPAAAGYDSDESAWEQVGDGQVHTTVADLLRWADHFRQPRLTDANVMTILTTPGRLNDGKELDYAAGLVVTRLGDARVYRHGGAWAGYRAGFLYFPDHHYSVVVLCNRSDAEASSMAESIASEALGVNLRATEAALVAVKPVQPAKVVSPPMSVFTGSYHSAEANARCTLVEAAGQLRVEGCMAGQPAVRTAERQFLVEALEATLDFETGADGRAAAFQLDAWGMRGLRFERVAP